MGTALVLVKRDALARESGLHPDLVRRLVSLGAVEPNARDAAARLARITRLRRDLGLNYAGAILAMELLARIDELEARLASREAPRRTPEVMAWTRTS